MHVQKGAVSTSYRREGDCEEKNAKGEEKRAEETEKRNEGRRKGEREE